MNQLTTFTHNMGSIRMLQLGGKPWFVAKDVAIILGYKKPENAIMNHVDCEDKTTTLIQGSGSNYKSKTLIINESGLYSLILSSKLPKAKAFKHWVTSEVLPAVHSNGFYASKEMIHNPDFLIELGKLGEKIKQEQEEKAYLKTEIQQLSEALTQCEPKLSYLDKILSSKSTLTSTQIAADYGISARKLNEILHNERVQWKVGNQWILYKEYMNQNLTNSETILVNNGTRSVVHTKWTQTGRLLIHNILLSRGFEPL